MPDNESSGQSDGGFDIVVRKRKLPNAEPKDIPGDFLEGVKDYTLYVRDLALIGIRQYANQDTEKEVGGVLFGVRYQREDRVVVFVKDYMPLRSGSRSRTHFDFDSQALQDLHARQQSPESYIVGWFHSHVRLGDPFMSLDDQKLHVSYFKEPWYVSCVVGSGEWTMPIGFWRMKEGQLVEIREHFLLMTATDPPGEQTRRYFRSAVAEERPLQTLITRVASLPALNSAEADLLIRAFEPALLNEAANPTRSVVMSPLFSVIDLALAIARSPDKLQEFQSLSDHLQRMRFLEDAVDGVIFSEGQKERIAVCSDRAFSLTPGEREVVCSDFVLNLIWPVVLEPQTALIDLAASSDGKLWVLTSQSSLVNLSEFVGADPLSDGRTPQSVFHIPQLESELKEISATPGEIWLRSQHRAFRLIVDWLPDPPELTLVESMKLEGGVLLRGAVAGDEVALTVESGALHLLGWDGCVASASLPDGWPAWPLLSAGSCAIGVLALFDDGVGGQLALFDRDSLELIHHYRDSSLSTSTRMMSVGIDESRRAFVRSGISIGILTASGSPNPTWYHFRTEGKRRRSRHREIPFIGE